jgi:ribosome biogenesis GTP-binding protein YlqF
MPSQTIQWFPGHMAKTRRMIEELLPQVDLVLELCDARIPYSSRNPILPQLIGEKPKLTVLTKSMLADPCATDKWRAYFAASGQSCLFCDCVTGTGINNITDAVRELMSDKLERYEARGMSGRVLRAIVVGIPNVGKSSLINKLAGAKKAKVEDRPGVTREKQWISTKYGLDLLDTPGVLWPKFDDQTVGENLAITGAVKDDIVDTIALAVSLIGRLRASYPTMLAERFKLGNMDEYEGMDNYDVFLAASKKRGFIMSGGRINEDRAAAVILDEFRSAKIGRITLELP